MKYFTPAAVLVGPALVEVLVLQQLLLLDFVVVDKVVVTGGAVVVVLAVVDVAVPGTHWTGETYQLPSCSYARRDLRPYSNRDCTMCRRHQTRTC
jgi:hypothetical protein